MPAGTHGGNREVLVVSADRHGKQTEVYDGIELSLNARFGGRGRLAGGVSTGHTAYDVCAVVDSPSVVTTTQPMTGQQPLFCQYEMPWRGQTQVKLNGSYPLPWDLDVSGVFQNLPGIPITASYGATNAEIRSTLGRNLGQCGTSATCTATVVVNNLYEPNTRFAERLTQFDVRLTKNVKVGHARVQGMFDVYNLFNASTVLALNNRYSVTGTNAWLQPTSILAGRLFKFGVQLEY